MLPNPTWNASTATWSVDLRKPWGLGRRVVDAPPPPAGVVAAVHAAYALLARLRDETTSAQLSLPVLAGKTLGDAAAEYLAEREYAGTAGEWLRANVALLRKEEVGKAPLACFVAKEGADLLARWRDEIRGRGVGPRSMKDRLNVFRLVWRWCADIPRQWVTVMPVLPTWKKHAEEVLSHPVGRWVDESTFRAARAGIYDNGPARLSLQTELKRAGLPSDAAAVHDVICRRQLYLSFAFYTGMRRKDLNAIDDGYLSPDFGCYWRHGRKTGIEKAAEAICPPFASDLAVEFHRLGRSYRSGELICGGPWWHAPRVLRTAARNVGVEAFGLMDCRRSFVYHKALAGVPEEKLVNLMGHAGSKMIRSVYLMLQPRLQRDEAGAAWPRSLSALPGTGPARILTMRKKGA